MIYKEIPPPPALADIVRYFWIIESDDETLAPQKYRLFAESSPGLVFFYHFNYGLVSGIQDCYREFMMPGKFGMMGAFLYPYALPLLFNESADVLTNTTVEIVDFLGNEGKDLKENVIHADTNSQRIEIISRYLLAKKKSNAIQPSGLLKSVQEIVRYKGAVSLDSLVDATGVSVRQFDRRFSTGVGISPKVFTRLIRFHSTLQLPRQREILSLTTLAFEAGYYDQSHFIRDFKAFAGLSPKQYFNLEQHHAADNFIRMTA